MDDWTFLLEQARHSWRGGSRTPARVVAAVSGGADSVALLLVLAELAPQEGFSLSAAHVDHGLRPDSGQDAAYVSALCEGLHVPCRVFSVRVNGKSEDAARQARYDALLNGYPEEKGYFLALAHHQRDQAETMLLHLFRGSGGSGLGGMTEYSRRAGPDGAETILWRPFLSVTPEKIRQALRNKGIPWREDFTNAQDDYLRNYLRHHVLPAVRRRIPEAEGAMARTARILRDEADYFRLEAERFLQTNACLTPPCRCIQYPALCQLHPALRRHILRFSCPVPLDYGQTEDMLSLAPGQTANLPGKWRAFCTAQFLHFLSPLPEKTPLGDITVLPWRSGETGDGKRVQALPSSIWAQCTLRTWQTGDWIHPLGAKGKKSMQDYFTDHHIDRPLRPHTPLLCIGGEVIWVIGTGVSERARVNPGNDAVLLQYDGFLPGECRQ